MQVFLNFSWVNYGQLGSILVNLGQLRWTRVNLGRLWSTWVNHYLKRRKFFKLFSGHLKRRNFFYLFSWGFTIWISPKRVSKILFVNEGYPNIKFLTSSLGKFVEASCFYRSKAKIAKAKHLNPQLCQLQF